MTNPRPVNPVFVLSNGTRVGMDLRACGRRPTGNGAYWHVWQPIIEGDLLKLMPMVVAMDADDWPAAAALTFPLFSGDRRLNSEWVQRIIQNSPCLQAGAKGITGGKVYEKGDL